MKVKKIVPLFCFFLNCILLAVVSLTYPVWNEIEKYLAMSLAVMPMVAFFLVLSLCYLLYLLLSKALTGPRAQKHLLVAGILSGVMLSPFFTAELGVVRDLARRYVDAALPFVLWLGAWVLVFLVAPYWQLLERPRARLMVTMGLMLAPLAWNFIPFHVAIQTSPVVFIQQDGLLVAWGTNMRSTGEVHYGTTPALGHSASNQSHGLKQLSQRVQHAYLVGTLPQGSLYFKVLSQGIHSILPSFAIQGGQAESDIVKVDFPDPTDGLTFVAFSDFHEQRGLSRRMAEQIDWSQMEMALYLGDLINFSDSPLQTAQAIVDLPTGGYHLPRIYLRGNHEVRGEMARQLGDWLLPPDGKWYYTFEIGDTFFVALDSGEDKGDDSQEYAGLTDFAAYHQEQAAWLKTVFASPQYQQAKRRIVLVHIPPFVEYPAELAPIMDLLKSRSDIDLVMSGHIHDGSIWLPEETGLPFAVTTCGGSQIKDMAAVVVDQHDDGINLKVINIQGEIVEEKVIP